MVLVGGEGALGVALQCLMQRGNMLVLNSTSGRLQKQVCVCVCDK